MLEKTNLYFEYAEKKHFQKAEIAMEIARATKKVYGKW